MNQSSRSLASPLNSSPYSSPQTLWALVIGFVFIWLYMLGARTLVPTDEGRYAEMAREMVATGDWITLRLNGIKYFEKPPLQNWMNAITFSLFGLGEWQARLWTGLCGLLGIAATAYTGAKVFNRNVGITAGLVLASSFWWAGFGHVNTLDMGLSGMMTLTICGLLLAQRDEASATERRNAMLIAWAGMALATMSKGLIGFVLPGAVLVIYTGVSRDWAIWTRLHFFKGLLVFFAITTPWFILVWQHNPEHPHFFFIHEHWQRFTSKVHHREGAWYYFFPMLIVGIIPWLGLLVQGLAQGFKRTTSRFQAPQMLLIWTVFIFFFFSISGSKLPSYILPIFPSIALLIALQLEKLPTKSLQVTAILLALLGLVAVFLVHKLPTATTDTYAMPLYKAAMPWSYVAALVALIGGGLALWLAKRNQQWTIVTLAVAGFLAGQAAFLATSQWGDYSAGIKHVAAIQAELTPETTIYTVGKYEQSLPFYLQRTLVMVEHADELEFGLGIQPELWIPKREDFVQQWRDKSAKGQVAIAILRPELYPEFVQQQLPMRIIGQDPKRIIVTNQLKNK